MNLQHMTMCNPLAAIFRCENGSWAAELGPGRYMIGRSKEEALGLFMIAAIEKSTGRTFPDESFPMLDLTTRKGGGA